MSTTTWYIVGGVLTPMFGILVMIFPKILNYLVGALLIIGGIATLIYALVL